MIKILEKICFEFKKSCLKNELKKKRALKQITICNTKFF